MPEVRDSKLRKYGEDVLKILFGEEDVRNGSRKTVP